MATATAVVGGVLVTYTPLFGASDIRVVASPMPRGELLAVAGIDGGSNVFHLDADEAERRLEADPRVLAATVTASLPSHVVISITPRRPVGLVGSPPELVGPDGALIGPAGAGRRALPVLRGEHLASAAATAAAMTPGLRRRVEAIAVRPDGAITVRVDAGFSADLGEPTELEAKAASLEALLRWAAGEGVRIVSADVTVAASPTARLADGETATPSG